jgi:hypothetical protein
MWHWYYLFIIPIIASLLFWLLCKRSDVEPNSPQEDDLYNSIADELIFKDKVHEEAARLVANSKSKANCDHCYRFQCEGCELFKPSHHYKLGLKNNTDIKLT